MKRKQSAKDKGPEKAVSGDNVELSINRLPVDPVRYVSLYVNDTQVQVTPWDFRFILGVVGDTPTVEDPYLTVSTLGEIRMSPQHVKRVVKVLLGQLQAYETIYGPIPEPKDGG